MFLDHPTHYTAAEFRTMLSRLRFARGWKPDFPTLHNTGVPSLRQWLAYGATPQERWGANLNAYYKGLGWHAGPHVVCCPDYVWVLSDPEADGVSVSCWNRVTFGVEMLGNFETGGDDFASGAGARVRDNAVFVLAALCEKFGWEIADVLRFHRECARDRHACPGSRVSKADIVQRVHARLESWGAAAGALASGLTDDPVIVANSQTKLIACGYSCGPAGPDGVIGPATRAAVDAFRRDKGLPPGGHDLAFRNALSAAYGAVLSARGAPAAAGSSPVSKGA